MDPALLTSLDAALRGAVLALLGLMLLRLLHGPRKLAVERVGLPLVPGLAVQIVSSWPLIEQGPPSLWRAALVGISMGNALLFWLWVLALCDDGFAPRPRHAAAWGAVVLAGGLNLAVLLPWCAAGGPGWAQALSRLLLALPMVFGLLTMAVAVARWQDDLVERRRWLRAGIVVVGTVYTLLQVLVRHQRPDNRLSPEAAAVDAATMVLMVGAAAWLLFLHAGDEVAVGQPAAEGPPRPTPDHAPAPAAASPAAEIAALAAAPVQLPVEAPPAAATQGLDTPPQDAEAAADLRLVEALRHAMEDARAYRDPELSVAGLAARLRVPEYRLRRVIHQRLGHRHFSAYLNHYRLIEVQAALADPSRAERPVLTLALEAGFGSVGPFNRAFKALTGLTPTDFRRQRLADS